MQLYIMEAKCLYCEVRTETVHAFQVRSGVNQNCQKPSSHFKILGGRTVTQSQFHTEDLRILGGTEQNLVVVAICTARFVHPWVL